MISKTEAREAPVTRVMMPPATPNTLNTNDYLIDSEKFYANVTTPNTLHTNERIAGT